MFQCTAPIFCEFSSLRECKRFKKKGRGWGGENAKRKKFSKRYKKKSYKEVNCVEGGSYNFFFFVLSFFWVWM